MCLVDGVATARYMVCIARHVGPAEKSMPAFSLQQFTTKQDLNGKILACDTRFVRTALHHESSRQYICVALCNRQVAEMRQNFCINPKCRFVKFTPLSATVFSRSVVTFN